MKQFIKKEVPTVPVIFGSNWLPFSILVKLFTLSWTNHCGLVAGDYVYEARLFKGVVKTPMDEFKKRYKKSVIKQVECYDIDETYTYIKNSLGKKYDLLGALGIGLRLSFLDDDNKYSCSELLAKAGVGRFSEKTRKIVSPEWLWAKRTD